MFIKFFQLFAIAASCSHCAASTSANAESNRAQDAYQYKNRLLSAALELKKRVSGKIYPSLNIELVNPREYPICLRTIYFNGNSTNIDFMTITSVDGKAAEFRNVIPFRSGPTWRYLILSPGAHGSFTYDITALYKIDRGESNLSLNIIGYNCRLFETGYPFDIDQIQLLDGSTETIGETDIIEYEIDELKFHW